MKKQSGKKKSYTKREPRQKTGWEHHEDLIVNLRDWCLRQRESMSRDLGPDEETIATVHAAWEDMKLAFDRWSAVVQEQLEKVFSRERGRHG